jgi:hypothetical protein
MALDCSNAEAEDIAAGIPRRSAIQKIFSQNGRFPHPAASIRAHGAPSARTGRVATFRTGARSWQVAHQAWNSTEILPFSSGAMSDGNWSVLRVEYVCYGSIHPYPIPS